VPDTGLVGLGNMKLMEMFSPLGGPRDDGQSDIDWMDDLKFFIDNDDMMLKKHMFPAVEKHKKFVDHPDAYKLYIKPLKQCLGVYCETFEIEDPEDKFTEEKICSLAKKIANEQKTYIEKKDYDRK
jgi:hypothetical protein